MANLTHEQRAAKMRAKLAQQGLDADSIDNIMSPPPPVSPDLPDVDHKVLVLVARLNGKRIESLTEAEIREAAVNPPEEPTFVTVQDDPPFIPSTLPEALKYRAQQLGVDERNLTDINIEEARQLIVRKDKKKK